MPFINTGDSTGFMEGIFFWKSRLVDGSKFLSIIKT